MDPGSYPQHCLDIWQGGVPNHLGHIPHPMPSHLIPRAQVWGCLGPTVPVITFHVFVPEKSNTIVALAQQRNTEPSKIGRNGNENQREF
jgi:hypothetical protein